MWSQRSQQEKKTEGRRNRKHSKCGKKKASLTEQHFSVHLLKTPNQTQSFQLVKTSQQRQIFLIAAFLKHEFGLKCLMFVLGLHLTSLAFSCLEEKLLIKV